MKPHIYKSRYGRNVWYCSDGCWLGWGRTANDAWVAWKNRWVVNSCVHQRETPLKLRLKHATGGWIASLTVA